jgi:hypothetical protein
MEEERREGLWKKREETDRVEEERERDRVKIIWTKLFVSSLKGTQD